MRHTLQLILLGLSLTLAGCQHTALCFQQDENAHVHTEFGYFYDSATLDVNGKTNFARIPEDMGYNPCLTPPPVAK